MRAPLEGRVEDSRGAWGSFFLRAAPNAFEPVLLELYLFGPWRERQLEESLFCGEESHILLLFFIEAKGDQVSFLL